MFFQFFKILILWVVRGVKVHKTVQNDKKFCPSHLISQEPYIIQLSLTVRMCKMIISPGVIYHFFKILIFQVFREEKAKNGQKWQKFVCCTLYFRNHISYDLHSWYTCMYKRIIFPAILFIFFQNFHFWDHSPNDPKWPKMTKNSVYLTLYVRNHTSYDCDFWYTYVKWYLQQFFSFFKILIFGVFRG